MPHLAAMNYLETGPRLSRVKKPLIFRRASKMKYFKSHSLYLVKGINYKGPAFSVLSTEYPRVSIFPQLSDDILETYAISTLIGSNALSCFAGVERLALSEMDISKRMAFNGNKDSDKGVFIQIINKYPTDIELVHYTDFNKKQPLLISTLF